MSGKRSKNQAEINKARNEYMENLTTEADIIEMNYQANKDYLANGTLPAITQMADMRTISEKLLDVEKLKQGIIMDFKPIAEPMFASNIVNGIMTSNLNVNGGLLRYLAQNAPEIVKQLSLKYKYGIAGDANDTETIISFISQMYSSTKNTLQSVKGYINSNTSPSSSGSNVLSANDIDRITRELTDIKKSLMISGFKFKDFKRNGNVDNLSSIIDRIGRIKDYLPSNQELQVLIEGINEASIDTDDDESQDIVNIFKILEELPKLSSIQTLLDILNKSLKNKDEGLFNKTVEKISSEFSTFFDDEVLGVLERYKYQVLQPIRQEARDRAVGQSRAVLAEQSRLRDEDNRANHAQNVRIVNPEDDEAYVRFGVNAPDAFGLSGVSTDKYTSSFYNRNMPNPMESFLSSIPQQPTRPVPPRPGSNVEGNGMKKRRGRPRGSGIVQKPVLMKVPNYTGFGINEISRKNLDKGILTIRRNTKSNIVDLPSRRISPKFKGVINSIIGGGVPNYNDLSTLDDEEKNYLYKLVEKSDLKSRLSVPAPSKDTEEKDIHSFEVMKGEILAGNDNKEMIKKFKLLTVKLTKYGLLPKNESSELLQLLVELGY